jgi:DNA-binding transcriptional MerR regulator
MSLIIVPPRQVNLREAVSFVGITPETIREYHAIGLLPEPARGSEVGQYTNADIVRLLWITRMADAGIAMDDIRGAFLDTAPAGATSDYASVRGRMSLLSEFVSTRLARLPEGSLHQADLDALLITEHMSGPLAATVQASRFIALATRPALRQECDRLDAAEKALDDTVAVEDPRVAQVAHDRHAFEKVLNAFCRESGLAQEEDDIFDSWYDENPDDDDKPANSADRRGKMPYDFSPAALRSMELSFELDAKA